MHEIRSTLFSYLANKIKKSGKWVLSRNVAMIPIQNIFLMLNKKLVIVFIIDLLSIWAGILKTQSFNLCPIC